MTSGRLTLPTTIAGYVQRRALINKGCLLLLLLRNANRHGLEGGVYGTAVKRGLADDDEKSATISARSRRALAYVLDKTG